MQLRVPVWSASSAPELESSEQTGASFVLLTVIAIVAVFESRVPSLALNVKLSAPLKSGSGVYVHEPSGSTVAPPSEGSATFA